MRGGELIGGMTECDHPNTLSGCVAQPDTVLLHASAECGENGDSGVFAHRYRLADLLVNALVSDHLRRDVLAFLPSHPPPAHDRAHRDVEKGQCANGMEQGVHR